MVTKIILAFIFMFWITSQGHAQPDWVKERPALDGYYIGIGACSHVAASKNAVEEARNRALAEIVSQIRVTVQFANRRIMEKNSLVAKKSFSSESSTIGKARLDGYEMVDTWRGPDKLWVYCRLSKSLFYSNTQSRNRALLDKCQRYIKISRKAAGPKEGLSNYIQLLNLLENFEPLGGDNSEEKRFNEYEQTISEGISRWYKKLRFTAPSKSIILKPGRALDSIIALAVTFVDETDSQKPAYGFPVKFFDRNPSDSTRLTLTSSPDGSVALPPNIFTNQATRRIKVMPDNAALAGVDSLSGSVREKLLRCMPPELVLEIVHGRILLYLDTDESGVNGQYASSLLTPVIKKALIKESFMFVKERTSAHFVIRLHAGVEHGPSVGAIHFAYANFEIKISENPSGLEMYSAARRRIKGAHMTFKDAAQKALSEAGDVFETELAKEITQEVWKK